VTPPPLRAAYLAAARAAALAAALVPATAQSKVWRSLAARRGIRERYANWAATGRDPSRPLVWLHAPSVGEGLQARPVAELLRARRPDVQLAYTFFSPSAERFARTVGADFVDYLPFDTIADARTALDALRPTALLFSKLDVWPVLVGEAARRGVQLGLLSATLAAGSSRRSRLATTLLRPAYAALHAVGAIGEDDAARLVRLGVPPAALRVTGDVRFDQVWARAAASDRDSPLLAPLASNRPTLVAGSTWPADEARLLPAWVDLRGAVPDARLVIAPHEPTVAHLPPIQRWAGGAGLTLARLGAPDEGTADVVLVDRVGVLGDLYALADVAYVGGGFHRAGLHSVLEPAAFGAPVAFGPSHANSREAGLLLAAGAGHAAPTTAALAAVLRNWLGDPAARAADGAAGQGVVRQGLGAAERSYAAVTELLAAGISPAAVRGAVG
jgi:3-deoxy-D-manno-octulosonic-acid transferase